MIEHNKPTIGKEEQLAVSKVLKSGYLSEGSEVKKFEDDFKSYKDSKFAIAVNSHASRYKQKCTRRFCLRVFCL